MERQKRLGLKRKARPSQGVRAPGLDNLLIRFSRCCNPVPGDDIVGYITRGRGVSVHRKDCPNLGTLSTEEGRIIEVFWEGTGQSSYPVELEVLAEDRVNLLSNIMLAVSEMKTNIVAVHGRTFEKQAGANRSCGRYKGSGSHAGHHRTAAERGRRALCTPPLFRRKAKCSLND